MSVTAPAVRLVNVSRTFPGGRQAAVRDVSLEIGEREFFSLLGPSGCGKSTALRMIAGLEHPDAGEVWLCGERAETIPPHRRPVHMVFQTYALFPHLTAHANVEFPLRMRRVARAERRTRAAEALDRVGMGEFAERLPHALSGGQRQRVALARAMVDRPKVLLLDEPLGALDLQLRQQMQKFLKEVQRQSHIAFVYVTHDQGEALAMSDRIAVMSAGAVEQIGAPAEIYERPATRFVAGFIGRTNLLEGPLEAGTGGGPVLRAGKAAVAVTGPPPPPGAAAARSLSIRPEKIRLGMAAAGCRNRFRGYVVEAFYGGAQAEMLVKLDEGFTLSVAVPGGGAVIPGTSVEIGWEPEDAVLL